MSDEQTLAEARATFSAAAVKEVQTRFLHPFTFACNHDCDRRVAEAVGVLLGDQLSRPGGKHTPLWECAEPRGAYRDELLEHVDGFLFGGYQEGGCGYLRVRDEAAQAWFRDAAVELPKRGRVEVRLVSGVGVELFLSPQGAGVLSIALAAGPGPLTPEAVLDFNYRLAQFRRRDVPRIRRPHPRDDAAVWERLAEADRAQIAPPPEDGLPLDDRLGSPGGTFTLRELARRLLGPLEQGRLLGRCGAARPVRDRCRAGPAELGVYTVVRLAKEDDFFDGEPGRDRARLLSGLAQVEEASHVGSAAGRVTVPHARLNRHHWAAVGVLGAAHLLADQGGVPFDEQRPAVVRDKYFTPYLLAQLQQRCLDRALDDASEAAAALYREPHGGAGRRGARRQMEALHNDLLRFAVAGHYTQVSTRHAVHRFYRLARRGLEVPASWQAVQGAVTDLDASLTADRQHALSERMSGNLTAIRRLQSFVHLVEKFIGVVTAAHLWHMFAADNKSLNEVWGGWLVSAGVVVAAGAGYGLVSLLDRALDRRHAAKEDGGS